MSGINVYTLDDLRAIVRENDPRIMITGEVFLDHRRDGNYLCFEEYQGKNIVPTEGLNYILDVVCGAESKPTAWYCGIFTGNYTPIATNTAANALGAAGLFTEAQDATYTPATNRPAYTVAAAAAGVLTNTASKAEFTIAASSTTIYGAFLASSQAKTATTGKLLAAKKFDTARAVVATDVLYVTYQITVTSS